MNSPDPEVEALLGSARAFSAYGAETFGYVERRPSSIALIPNALVTARGYVEGYTKFTGAVYDGNGVLVPSSRGFSEGEFTPLDPDTVPLDRLDAADRIRRAVYGGTLYSILGHFLFETVARLWHGVDFAPKLFIGRGGLPVVFHPWPGLDLAKFLKNPLYREVLDALGIGRGNILLAHADLAVDTLYYPSPLSIYHVTMDPLLGVVLDHVARHVARPKPFDLLWSRKPAPRVYLSRSRWKVHRRVSNEAGLEDLFRRHGFAIVHPQMLSPRELLTILHHAETVASTDGSQAHLVAFCRPGARTLLIDTRPVPTQFAIEKLRGLHGLHIPVCTNGQWDEASGAVDLSGRMDGLIGAALATS